MHFKAKIPWELGYGKDKNGHIPPCTDLDVELKVYEILEDVDDDEEDLVKGTVLYKVLENGNCEAEKGGGLYLDGDKTYTFHTEYEMHILKAPIVLLQRHLGWGRNMLKVTLTFEFKSAIVKKIEPGPCGRLGESHLNLPLRAGLVRWPH